MTKIRIAVVDDHEMVRYGLILSLGSEPDMMVVGEASTGEEAVALARRVRPDVMLMDVRLGDADGPAVCGEVLAASPGTAVVMLTSYLYDALILRSLAAGARGYVVKDVELAELKRIVRTVHRGQAVLDPRATPSVIATATGRRRAQPSVLPALMLSETDIAIVRHLAAGLTTRQIAARINLSPHTVKDHIEKIRVTLHARSRAEAVAEAIRRGLI